MTTDSKEAARAERLAAAKTIIRAAGDVALDYFSRLEKLTIERKTSGQDTVSEADRNVEETIRKAILERFPEDGLLGEEHGGKDGKSGYTWVIDPIDGTTVFLHGLPTWTVVIAILADGKPVLSCILVPAQNKLYHAIDGAGAFCNDRPIHVDETTPFDAGLFGVGPGAPEFAGHVGTLVTRLMSAGSMYLRFGSAAHSLALVAAGNLLGFYEPRLNAWDCVAGLLLVREAGGTSRGFEQGTDWTKRQPVIATASTVTKSFETMISESI
ncbi:inositol monophosphatase family protein [Martelella endophytica]|uniref:Inositol-1-monophosphatase n=1 Tax=Martelella endophytica TaxID=1486262 RepID=A0A0D5LVR7_MAREN|nr:inositol monophosphatase [Martelella endophytica]AJY47473.1 hypothetical protein TM49_20260 [Martelella endophytica]